MHSNAPVAGLIDLGNVLAAFSHEKACRQIAALPGASATPAEIYRFIFGHTGWEGLNHPLETGEISTGEFWERCRAEFGLDCGFDHFARAWADIFEVRPDVLEFLLAWSRRAPLHLCSNTNELHWGRVLELEPRAAEPFGRLFLSHEMGTRKPSPDYFRNVLAELGLEPSQCVFVDDMDPNLAAARDLGIQAVKFESLEQARRELAAMLGDVIP